jgi:hypothetical protein
LKGLAPPEASSCECAPVRQASDAQSRFSAPWTLTSQMMLPIRGSKFRQISSIGRLLVRSSIIGADRDSPAEFVNAHTICDRHLEVSGIDHVIVRAAATDEACRFAHSELAPAPSILPIRSDGKEPGYARSAGPTATRS